MTFDEAYESLNQKFTSGNDIPVERNTILREEWDAIKAEIDRLREIEVRYYYVHENKGRGKL